MMQETQWILFGHVRKAFGIEGALQLALLNDETENLRVGISLALQKGSLRKEWVIGRVLGGSRVFFEGLNDRTQAEQWAHAQVWIRRTDFVILEDEQFYLADLLGAQVFDVAGGLLGEIVAMGSNNAQTLLEVRNDQGHFVSIPLVPPILRSLCFEKRQVIVDPPEGLLELTYRRN